MLEEQQGPQKIQFTNVATMISASITGEDNQAVQASFLIKMFKNNISSDKAKRVNPVRLINLFLHFQKIVKKIPSDQASLTVLYQTIYALLKNKKNFQYEDQNYQMYVFLNWVARIMQATVQQVDNIQFPIAILSYLLYNSDIKLLTEEQFKAKLSESTYFSNLVGQKNSQDCEQIEEVKSLSILKPPQKAKVIFECLNLNKFFKKMFEKTEDKFEAKKKTIDNFFKVLKWIGYSDKFGAFTETFLHNIRNMQSQIQAIIFSSENQCFDFEKTTEIIQRVVNQIHTNYSISILSQINLKGFKFQDIFMQAILKETSKMPISNLIDLFLNIQQINTYFLLYLIIKSPEQIPKSYLKLLLSNQKMTNRKAVIIALTIAHHQNCFNDILQKFFQNQHEYNIQTRTNMLKAIHFSLQNPKKSAIFGQIFKYIPSTSLNQPSNLNFFPLQPLRDPAMEKQQRKTLMQFIKRQFDNNERTFKIKIDIYSMFGQTVPLLNKINSVIKIFEKPMDQIINNLYSVSGEILESVLMGINNKLQTTFLEDNPNLVEWICKTFNKYKGQFEDDLKAFLKKNNNEKIYGFTLSLIYYNMEKKADLCFDQSLERLLSAKKYVRVEGVSFADYYIQMNRENELIDELIRIKSILIELKELLKYFTSPGDNLSAKIKKQIKNILWNNAEHIFALQAINNYLKNQLDYPDTLNTLFQQITGQYKYLDQLSKKASQINQQYCCIISHLPKLLQVSYPLAITFTSNLLKSPPSSEQKEKSSKKKKKRSSKQEALPSQVEYTIQTLCQNIECIFGDPNSLENYEPIFSIIDKINAHTEKKILAINLCLWLSRITIFHCENYDQWTKKVVNLTSMWQKASKQVKGYISLKQIDRQFSILTDLLNTLYQKYRSQPNMLEIEKRILLTMAMFYNSVDESQMIKVQPKREIPKPIIQNLLVKYNLPVQKQTHYFQCHTCDTSICDICANFVHRIHDKSYTGKNGTCSHENRGQGENIMSMPIQPNVVVPPQRFAQNMRIFGQPNLIGSQLMPSDVIMMANRFRDQQDDQIQEYRNRIQQAAMKQARDIRFPLENLIKRESSLLVEREIEDKSGIKGCSQKAFQSIPFKTFENEVYLPAFKTQEDKYFMPVSQINVTPLSHLFLRQLQNNSFLCSEALQLEKKQGQPEPKIQLVNNKIAFFRSGSFKVSNREAPYMSRQISSTNYFIPPKKIMACNKKFMITVSHSIGFILGLQDIKAKFIRKQSQKKVNEPESQNNYKKNQIQGLNFEICEVIINPFNQEIFALTGYNHIGFFSLDPNGRHHKFLASDIILNETLLKFMWVHESKNTFAYATTKQVIVATISDSRYRKAMRITIGTNLIKDFSIAVWKKSFIIWILDQEGKVYRERTNGKVNSINFSNKNLQLNITEPIVAICPNKNKVFISLKNGTAQYLQFTQQNNIIEENRLALNFKKAISSKFEKNHSLNSLTYLVGLQILYQNQDDIFFAGIYRKQFNFNNPSHNPKKAIGHLAIVELKNGQENVIIFNEESQIDSFQIMYLEQGSFLAFGIQQDGNVWASRVSIGKASHIKNEDIKVTLNLQGMVCLTKQIKSMSLLNKIKYTDSNRCSAFKDLIKINDGFSITNNGSNIIIQSRPNLYFFIAGITLDIELISSKNPCYMQFDFLGVSYNFQIKNSRQVQLPLTLKQTLFLFTNSEAIYLDFKSPIQFTIKTINLYGSSWEKDSIYKNCIMNLAKVMEVFVKYPQDSIEHYLLNQSRHDFKQIQLQNLSKIMQSKGYGLKEINLILKLELLVQSLPLSSIRGQQKKLEDIIEKSKNTLLLFCDNKQYLKNSTKRLLKVLATLYSQLSTKPNVFATGFPYEPSTILDLYFAQKQYSKWCKKKSESSYAEILTRLHKLISRRVTNLYIFFGLFPKMVEELCNFFRSISQGKSSNKYREPFGGSFEKKRLSSLCFQLITIVCQYYQFLKNKKHQSAQKITFTLLETVFCHMKKDFYKEIFLNPFEYLEKMFISDNNSIAINCGVQFMNIKELSMQQDKMIEQEMEIELNEQQHKDSNSDQSPQESFSMVDQQEKEQQSLERMVPYENQQSEFDGTMKIQQSPSLKNMDVDLVQKQIINILLNRATQIGSTVNFRYHPFVFQLTISLFQQRNYINQINAVFYVGLLFNLLRVIEIRMNLERDKEYLIKLFKQIDAGIEQSGNSLLYLILNYFIQSDYYIKLPEIRIKGDFTNLYTAQTRICKQLINFYMEGHAENPINKLQKMHFTCNQQVMSMNEIITFATVKHANNIYNLKFLGNLYINLKRAKYEALLKPDDDIKKAILNAFVKNKLRILSNIMLFEEWQQDLKEARVDVGFQLLQQKGIQMLYDCSIEFPQIFINTMKKDPKRVEMLDQCLQKQPKKTDKILQILNVYYSQQ